MEASIFLVDVTGNLSLVDTAQDFSNATHGINLLPNHLTQLSKISRPVHDLDQIVNFEQFWEPLGQTGACDQVDRRTSAAWSARLNEISIEAIEQAV